VVKVSN